MLVKVRPWIMKLKIPFFFPFPKSISGIFYLDSDGKAPRFRKTISPVAISHWICTLQGWSRFSAAKTARVDLEPTNNSSILHYSVFCLRMPALPQTRLWTARRRSQIFEKLRLSSISSHRCLWPFLQKRPILTLAIETSWCVGLGGIDSRAQH